VAPRGSNRLNTVVEECAGNVQSRMSSVRYAVNANDELLWLISDQNTCRLARLRVRRSPTATTAPRTYARGGSLL
jgi:hypothetical protein